MKVLVIDEWIPWPLDCGKKIRTFNLLKQLSADFDITLMCYSEPSEEGIAQMKRIDVKVEVVPDRRLTKWTLPFYARVALNLFERVPFSTVYHARPEFVASIRSFVVQEKPSVIHCEWTNLAPLLEGMDLSRVVIASHNIESAIWYRLSTSATNPLKKLVGWFQAKRIENLERFWYPRVAGCTSVSELDNQVIESYGARSRVVENGVDVAHYTEIQAADQENLLVFTASYDTFSNQDAVDYFVREIWGLVRRAVSDAQVVFVGKCPNEKMKRAAASDASIHLTDRVEDVRPYLAKARVCIVPLRIGGGSRLKIFEAMAMGKPIVSTRIGAEGIDLVDGQHILLQDDPAGFADAVVRCLRTPDLRASLGMQAFEYVKKHYDWASIAKKQRAIWREVGGDLYPRPHGRLRN